MKKKELEKQLKELGERYADIKGKIDDATKLLKLTTEIFNITDELIKDNFRMMFYHSEGKIKAKVSTYTNFDDVKNVIVAPNFQQAVLEIVKKRGEYLTGAADLMEALNVDESTAPKEIVEGIKAGAASFTYDKDLDPKEDK